MSQSLFTLIKSLTPTEKGYIKKSGPKATKGSHLELMIDEISKMAKYDEEKLIKKLGDKIPVKNLSKYKIDAIQTIQRRLTLFHEEKHIEIKLHSLFNQAIVLHKKGLFDLAVTQYEKTLKLALEYEENALAISIYFQLFSLYYSGKLGVNFPYLEDFKKLISKAEGENKMQILNAGLAEIMFSDHLSEKEKLSQIQSIQSKAENINDKSAFITQWGEHCINTHANYLLKNHEKADESKKVQIEFLKAFPKIHEKEPLRHLKHLINYVNGKFNISAYDEIPDLLAQLKELNIGSGLTDHCEFLKWSCYYIHAVNFELQTGNFTKAENVLNAGLNWYQANEKDVPDYFKMLFYDAAFITKFGNGNFKEALFYLNKLNNYKSEFRRELQISVKFYALILHFELENFDIIGSKIRSLYRELITHQPQLNKESQTIKWIKKAVSKVGNKNELKFMADDLLKDLLQLHENTNDSLMYFPFLIAWLTSYASSNEFSENYKNMYLETV